jgi:hypothetical protein
MSNGKAAFWGGPGYDVILLGDSYIGHCLAVDYDCEEAVASGNPLEVYQVHGSHVQVYPSGDMYYRE